MNESLLFLDGRVTLYPGDCRDVIRALPDASIDSCVTDPPYALVSIVKRFGRKGAAPAKGDVYARASAGFMGQGWDTGEVAFDPDFWAEVLRVLKPGAHLVAFGGTRSYHRLACAIEDAGFEIRDQLAWVYGSGFPKNHDVSKGIAKRRTEDIEPQRAVGAWLRARREQAGLSQKAVASLWPSATGRLTGCVANWELGLGFPTLDQWAKLKARIGFDDTLDHEVERLNDRKRSHGARWSNATIIGLVDLESPGFGDLRFDGDRSIRALDDDAAAWHGWGTALKPAWEPIVLARAPLVGSVAETVLAYGTGGVNIDGCRIQFTDTSDEGGTKAKNSCADFGLEPRDNAAFGAYARPRGEKGNDNPLGRWPANFVHDGSYDVIDAFPDRASRFFYSAKADANDRIGSKHPTVKPVDLMQWLCRLVTPPGGTVLDPFAGTGTTGEAAFREGFRAELIEREADYRADIARRMDLALAGPATRKSQSTKARGRTAVSAGPLFGNESEASSAELSEAAGEQTNSTQAMHEAAE